MQQDSIHDLLIDLKFCSMKRDLQRGRKIHAKTVESQNEDNKYVVTALIKMYGKCARMADARDVFDSVQKPAVVCWNALLLGYAENGEGTVVLEMFSIMKAHRYAPDCVTYVAALKACTCLAANGKKDSLKRGREIHAQIGCQLDFFLQNALIDMYAKCGSMIDARAVFDSVQIPDVISWNTLLLGYAENGNGLCALEMFSRMKVRGCIPDSRTYVSALKACTSLAVNGKKDSLNLGREIHAQIDCHLNHYVQNALIDMYAKCGSMPDARDVFNSIHKPDVVSWNALLLGYADNGDGRVALEMFSRMKTYGCMLSSVTYVVALKACTCLAVNDCLARGREIHLEIGCHTDVKVHNTLIDMYAKCGSMVDARNVFDSLHTPNVVSWNALLLGYAANGEGLCTLEMFSRMKRHRCTPDCVTYVAALRACGLTGALALGRKFHLEISEIDAYLVTCLVDFYAKCGSMVEARGVFDLHSRTRDASTWTALLAGYGIFGDTDSVFKLFEAMQNEGIRPDAVIFVCLLLCCSHAGLVEKARMYFEAMSTKYKVSPRIKHYTCMVDVLGRTNQMSEAISLIRKMPFIPDAVMWTTLLGACRKWKNVKMGELAFQSLVDIDRKNSSAYVLMALLYGSVEMWEEQERVLGCRTEVFINRDIKGEQKIFW